MVFKIDPAGNETVLNSFTGTVDGGHPIGGVVLDAAGNLYGTASYYGIGYYGTIFGVSPGGTLTFTEDDDGGIPTATLLPYGGYLFGTTEAGSPGSVVFKLSLH